MPKRTTKNSKKAASKQQGKTNTKNGSMKMTMYTVPTLMPRQQVKERVRTCRPGGKRVSMARTFSGKARSMIRRTLDPCENSNDSGLGFDQHLDRRKLCAVETESWSADRALAKRPKVDIKLENDEVNDNYSFPEHTHIYRDGTTSSTIQASVSGRAAPRCLPLIQRPSASPIGLTTQLQPSSRYMDIALSIVSQPEQQHRARYQTEGSRGAVKDRSGNGFPVVQLTGYNKPTTLQVFIGSDQGKVAPHMFYQACKVSGKNSTPCNEHKIDGTVVIELQLEPAKEMQGTCDCVGILKERNVDVEHRFPDQLCSRAKKKSTRCRMVFRTTVTHADGTQETLQVCSQPIVCTQPPGVPEISKKSLTSCPASGGLELFIIGKNFLKDTVVYFQSCDGAWEQSVVPDKEFLQQTHLICVVPQFLLPDITEPVTVRLYVMSSGKTSEPHQFVYTPVNGAMPSVHMEALPAHPHVSFLSKMMPPPGSSLVPQRRLSSASINNTDSLSPPMRCSSAKQDFIQDENSQNSLVDASELRQRFRAMSESSLDVHPGDSNMSLLNENSMDLMHHGQMMHENSNLSIVNENSNMEVMPSAAAIVDESSNHYSPKRSPEVMDLRRKMPMATVADLVQSKEPSMATLQSFGVTESNVMPFQAQSAQSIENYLTNIENKSLLMLTTTADLNAASTATYLNQQIMTAMPSDVVVVKSETSPIGVEARTAAQQPGLDTEGLNILVNCAVDSIVPPKDSNVLLSQDVMMPPMINTNLTPPPMAQSGLGTPNSNISPEVILNSQISPSLMCGSATQDALLPPANLPMCQSAPAHNVLNATPESAIILSAAADLLETQKNLNEMLTTSSAEVMPINQMQNAPAMNASFFSTTSAETTTAMVSATNSIAQDKQFLMPVANASEKLNEDVLRLMPPSLATMSDNDLINIINPNRFDQV